MEKLVFMLMEYKGDQIFYLPMSTEYHFPLTWLSIPRISLIFSSNIPKLRALLPLAQY